MPTVIAWGELCWDLFPDGPRLGGALANVAYHAAVLGARSILVSRVGDDELGRRAISELSARRVETRFVQVDATRPTGTVRVELSDGEPRYSIGEQAAWDAIALEAALVPELALADAFVFGTLAQRTPLGSATLAEALGRVGSGCVRIVDLNVRPPHDSAEVITAAIRHADVVKLNDAEAVRVARALETPDAAEFLLSHGARLIAVTHGRRGAELRAGSQQVSHPGFVVDAESGDSVGAGDAFSACLAVELARGAPLDVVLARANRYASFVASRRGAMPEPTREILDELAAIRSPR